MPNIRLTKADERGLSIPAHSVISIIGVENDPSDTFPLAKSLLRYDFGNGVSFAWVLQSSPDVAAQVSENDVAARPWLEFATPKGDAIFLLAPAVLAYEGLPADPEAEGPQAVSILHFDTQVGARRPGEPEVKWARIVEDEEEVARRIEEALNPATEAPAQPAPPKVRRPKSQ